MWSAGDQVILNQRLRFQVIFNKSSALRTKEMIITGNSFCSQMLYSVPMKNLCTAYPVDIGVMKPPGSSCHSILNK